MNLAHAQRGMSLMGLLALAALLGFVFVIGLKLFPVYLESWQIGKAMKQVVSDPGVASRGNREIVIALVKQLDIDGVTRIKEKNWTDVMTITKSDRNVTLDVYYEVETPLVGNLSLLAVFDKTESSL